MHGLLPQLQVIYAIVIRETRTRFGRHRLGYVWALIEPCAGIGTFALMFYFLGRTGPSGMPVLPFLTTGFLTYFLFTHITSKSIAAVSANKGLLYYPHVTPLDLVIARSLLEVVTHVIVFAILLGGYAFATRELHIADPLTVLFGLGLASVLGSSFGLFLCGLAVFWETTERLWGPFSRPLFWLSGLFFTAASLPTQVRDIFLYNPILHCVEIVRGGWFETYPNHHGNPVYVLGWILVASFLGLTLERVARRKLEMA